MTHAISPVAHPYPRPLSRNVRPPCACPRPAPCQPGIRGNKCNTAGTSCQTQTVSYLPCTHVSHRVWPDHDTEPPDGQRTGMDKARTRSRLKGPPQETAPTPGRESDHRNPQHHLEPA